MPRWGRRLFRIALAVCACCWGAELPDAANWEGQRIVAVRFEPDQQPLSPDQLARAIRLKPGMPFQIGELRAAIKALYATGRYTDIAADGEPANGGLAIIFRTRDQWFVGPVVASGKVKNPPNRGQIVAASNLDLGQPFTPEELEEATGRILNILKQNGFFEAKVQAQVARDPAHQQVSVTFLVDPGKRAHFRTPVVTGQPVLPPEEVAGATKWKRWFWWKQVTAENAQRGIQNVRKKYQDKDRLMASVRLEGMEYHPDSNTVTPTLNVTGGPKVEVHTVGAKVSGKKLKRYVPIYDEGTVDRDLLTEGVQNLRDYFQNEGYFDVEVDFQEKRAAPDHEDIVYVVNLGRRQKLVHVGVQGNRYFGANEITERMMIQPAGWLRMRHGRYSQGFVRRDKDTIESLYQANGFRDVKVNIQTIDDYRGKRDEMAAILNIEEGPQYLVSDFSLSGVTQLDRNEVLPQLASISGQPFSEINVALDRDYIIRTYNAAGFPDARFDWAMKPGPGPHQMSVRYIISEGQRRYIRDVLVSGMEETRWRLVRPVMRVKPGEPLSLSNMTGTQRDLYELGIFDKVDTAVQNPDGDTDHKYVLYSLEEGHRYALAGGFGAEVARIGGSNESWESPAGKTGFSPRASLDFSRLNLWGLGHSLNFKGRVSTLQRQASLNYFAPRYRNIEGRNITVTALYDNSRNVRTFTAKRLEGSAQLSQKLSKATTMLYRLTYRRVSVDQSTLKINPLLVPQLSQPVRLGILSGNWIQDRRDDPTDAHKGMYNTVDAGLASNLFGSRRSFGRILATNSTYKSLGRNFVLARRLEIGWLAPFKLAPGLTTEQAIPLPERLFGGGSTSHRGFPDNQAGPRDPYSGFPLGGNSLVIHNTELRFPLIGDNIDGVLFHDMGNVFSRPGHISFRFHQRNLTDFDYTVHAVGFGIRYRTPVGPVRVDLAYSINPPRFEGFKGTPQQLLANTAPRVVQGISHFQFFFSIGQAF